MRLRQGRTASTEPQTLGPRHCTHMASGVGAAFEELPHDGTCDECEPDEAPGAEEVCRECGFCYCHRHAEAHRQKFPGHHLAEYVHGSAQAWTSGPPQEGEGKGDVEAKVENERDVEVEMGEESESEEDSESEEESETEEESKERARDLSEPIGTEQVGAGRVKLIRDEVGGAKLRKGVGFDRADSDGRSSANRNRGRVGRDSRRGRARGRRWEINCPQAGLSASPAPASALALFTLQGGRGLEG